jgi:hypothetical protein
MYKVPKNGNATTIFCGSMWIGGLDIGGNLHTAATTYRQNGVDFWPGPVMDSANYSPLQDTLWNKLYRINKSTIDSFRSGLFGNVIPASILDWPGNGNTSLGEMPQLAPYVDANKNGVYDPVTNGTVSDYPLIRGDQAMYMIYNDDRTAHTESGGAKFGIEIHLMAYQFASADIAVNEATFLHYDIYNRSNNNYHNVYIGNWLNTDIGLAGPSYDGCDTLNNFWYAYNKDSVNTSSIASDSSYYYGATPPAQALAYLCDTMKHFMFYNNDFTVKGNPVNDAMYYNYLKSEWGDSSHVTYGGNGYKSSGVKTNYMMSGSPVTGSGWSEITDTAPAGDERGISSIGPINLNKGGSKSLDVALVFAMNPKPGPKANLQSVALLESYVADVKNFYNNESYGCDTGLVGIHEISSSEVKENIQVFPNPGKGIFNLKCNTQNLKLCTVDVYNMLGEKVYSNQLSTFNSQFSIDLSGRPAGVYLYRVVSANGQAIASGKLVIE